MDDTTLFSTPFIIGNRIRHRVTRSPVDDAEKNDKTTEDNGIYIKDIVGDKKKQKQKRIVIYFLLT